MCELWALGTGHAHAHPTYPHIQNPASSIQHPASNIQHPVSSIQHPVSSIQYPASSNIWIFPQYFLSFSISTSNPMKKCFYLFIIAFLILTCEVDPELPACYDCEFSTIDDYWEETICDMTFDEINDYEYQVYQESGGEIEVTCYFSHH